VLTNGALANVSNNTISPNIIILNGSGTYTGHYVINMNKINEMTYLQAIIYNGSYIYFFKPIMIRNSSA